MNTLIIAEKKSQADTYRSILFDEKRGLRGAFGNVSIEYTNGHIFSLYEPQMYQERWHRQNEDGTWKESSEILNNLPVFPEEFKYFASSGKSNSKGASDLELFNRIQSKAIDADQVIIATDLDNEGEAIARNVINHIRFNRTPKLLRLKFNSQTPDDFAEAFKTSLVPAENFDGAYQAAITRAEEDWLVGMNGSRYLNRALSQLGYSGNFTIGTVQGPIAAKIIEREREIQNWDKENNVKLVITDRDNNTTFISSNSYAVYTPKSGGKLQAEAKLKQYQSAKWFVDDVEIKRGAQPAPGLFKYSALLSVASKKFNWSIKKVDTLYRWLYTNQDGLGGFLSYPRTGEEKISHNEFEYLLENKDHYLKSVGLGHMPTPNTKPRSKYVTNGNIDHSANIPTKRDPMDQYGIHTFEEMLQNPGKKRISDDPKDWYNSTPEGIIPAKIVRQAEDLRKLYKLVVSQTMLMFAPDAVVNLTTVSLKSDDASLADDIFNLKGRVVDKQGWIDYAEHAIKNVFLPNYKEGDCINSMPNIEYVAPPSRYSETSLLGSPGKAGMLDSWGLGKPSTQSAIINSLTDNSYLAKDKKGLLTPTKNAYVMYDFFMTLYNPDGSYNPITCEATNKPLFLDAAARGAFESSLDDMAKGKNDLTKDKFISAIKEELATLIGYDFQGLRGKFTKVTPEEVEQEQNKNKPTIYHKAQLSILGGQFANVTSAKGINKKGVAYNGAMLKSPNGESLGFISRQIGDIELSDEQLENLLSHGHLNISNGAISANLSIIFDVESKHFIMKNDNPAIAFHIVGTLPDGRNIFEGKNSFFDKEFLDNVGKPRNDNIFIGWMLKKNPTNKNIKYHQKITQKALAKLVKGEVVNMKVTWLINNPTEQTKTIPMHLDPKQNYRLVEVRQKAQETKIAFTVPNSGRIIYENDTAFFDEVFMNRPKNKFQGFYLKKKYFNKAFTLDSPLTIDNMTKLITGEVIELSVTWNKSGKSGKCMINLTPEGWLNANF